MSNCEQLSGPGGPASVKAAPTMHDRHTDDLGHTGSEGVRVASRAWTGGALRSRAPPRSLRHRAAPRGPSAAAGGAAALVAGLPGAAARLLRLRARLAAVGARGAASTADLAPILLGLR